MKIENCKQEVEAATSTSNPVSLRFSSAVTTGQGGPYNNHWMATGVSNTYGPGRLGNKRAPIPTCGIPVTRASSSISVSPVCEGDRRPASAKTADLILATDGAQAEQQAVPNSTGSGSLESTQERELPQSEEGSLNRTDESDASEEEEDDEKSDFRRITRCQQKPPTRKSKEKKKVGRPIAYKGDPNAPELTEQERRRIKRRIANRESARRVRHKRQEILEEMQVKMEQIQAHNEQLLRHAREIEAQKSNMLTQLSDLESKLEKTTTENLQMQQEIQALRQSLQLKMSALEVELDKRANEAETSMPMGYCTPMEHSSFPLPMQVSQPIACTQQSFMETKTSLELKGPLEWFPSLNLDDLPSQAESLEMLNSMLHDDQTLSNSQAMGEAVC